MFNANKAFDRKVISGIASYLSRGVSWDLYVEEDLVTRLQQLSDWEGDGCIADFDSPEVTEFVRSRGIMAVAVGGSFGDERAYPEGYNYVATNNLSIARLGVEHLFGQGYRHLAFYGLPESQEHRWALERELAFTACVSERAELISSLSCYRGGFTQYSAWRDSLRRLQAWLESLPKPVGIMAATDSRARQLLDACHAAELKVPEQVAVLGVDDDDIIRGLTGNKLSTIRQGTERMGFLAAELLDKQLNGHLMTPAVHLVEPVGVMQSASTDFFAIDDDVVRQALDFIKHHACDGIQALHVLRELKLSRANVEFRFKQCMNSTIHQEIVKVQVDRVKQLLINTNLPLQSIAEEAGYSTVQYMTLAFKKRIGVTPGAYRRVQLDPGN